MLCTAPVLEYPRFDESFIITTDASNFALGAVLSQGKIGKDPAIAYASRSLHKAEIKYHTYEKEALAIMFAIKTFKNYVHRNKFTIVTDHKPLLWLKSVDNNTRVQKWRLKLSDYEFDIVYQPGKQNANADALSRNPVEIFVITRAQNKQMLNQNNEQPINLSNNDKIKIMNKNRQDIKGKWGRPRKKNDKNLTAAKKEGKIDENKRKMPKINNIIYSNNFVQFRNDNIVHLINLGKSLHKNTEILIKNKNIKPKLPFTENNIEMIDMDNKKLFMVYIDTSVSCKLIKESLRRLFNQLKELLITKNIQGVRKVWEQLYISSGKVLFKKVKVISEVILNEEFNSDL